MNYKEIESKWQKYWEEKDVFRAIDNSDKKPYYILVEFPYPSGSGLHVGHVRSYTAQDAMARMKRLQGFNFTCFNVKTLNNFYFANASSTETASATDAPTIGLLPIPIA